MKKLKQLARGVLPDSAYFLLKSQIKGHIVPDEPLLDEQGATFFRERIANSSIYLEYGSGGSTIAAYRATKMMFTVDSDARFLGAVEQKLAKVAGTHSQASPAAGIRTEPTGTS